jgi:YebC/PmpR family DNA-binding regulatory protein
VTYEAYGPAGVAMMIEVLTDNKNRTVAEIRHTLGKSGGNMGETGSVGWMFQKKGVFSFEKSKVTEDRLMDVALEAGADDIKEGENDFEVVCDPSVFEAVKGALDKAGLSYSSGDISMVPQNYVKLGAEDAEKMLKLMDALEDHDDVQKVYANFDIPDEIMEKLSA